MTEINEPFVFTFGDDDDEERRRREEEARAMLGDLSELSGIRVHVPEQMPAPNIRPPAEGRMRAENARDEAVIADAPRAQALGDAYRQQRGSTPDEVIAQVPGARVVNDPRTGRPQQVIYPPGVMPLPDHEQRSNAELYGDPPDARERLRAALQRVRGQAMPQARPSWLEEPDGGGVRNLHATDDDPAFPGRTRGAQTVRGALPGVDAVADRLGATARLESKPAGAAPPKTGARDYTAEDAGDVVRRILYTIGAGLYARSGHRPPEFRSLGREARDRDARTALEQTRAAQGASRTRMAERGLDLRERGLEADIAHRERGRELEEERNRISESMQGRRAQISEQRAALAMRASEAQIARLGSQEEREAAETDPTSQASRTAQAGVRIALQGYPPAARERIEAEYGSLDQLDARTARQVMQALPSMFRDLSARERAGGGGGGGGGFAQSGTREALVARARRVMSEEDIASYGHDRRRLLAEIEDREEEARRGGQAGEGVEIWTGVRGGSFVTEPEARGFRDGLARAGTGIDAVNALVSISRRHGLSAVIDPRIESQVAPYIMTLRGQATELQNTGTINAGEAPTINAALPDPTTLRGMTLRDIDAAANAWRNRLVEGVVRRARSLGVRDPAQLDALRRELRGGSGAPQGRTREEQQADDGARGQQPGDVIFVYNGRRRRVRAERVEAARAALRSAGTEFTEESVQR